MASSLRIEKQWDEIGVQGGGVVGTQRKKLSEKVSSHAKSKSHNAVISALKERAENKLTSALQEQSRRAEEYAETQQKATIQVFRTAYLAGSRRSFFPETS